MKKDKPDEMTLAQDKVKLEKPKKERTRKGPLKKFIRYRETEESQRIKECS